MWIEKQTTVGSLNGGTITSQVVAFKRESFAFIMSTEEGQKNQSVLSKVVTLCSILFAIVHTLKVE
jgi:hypothetical protein